MNKLRTEDFAKMAADNIRSAREIVTVTDGHEYLAGWHDGINKALAVMHHTLEDYRNMVRDREEGRQ